MIPEATPESLKKLSLSEIALLIRVYWPRVHPAAAPYLSAMECLSSVNENYGLDSGRSIVAYFLCNAASFKGTDEARIIKKELNRRIK